MRFFILNLLASVSALPSPLESPFQSDVQKVLSAIVQDDDTSRLSNLLSSGIKIDYMGPVVFDTAVKNEKYLAMKELFKYRALNLGGEENRALRSAIAKGDMRSFFLLMRSNKVDPAAFGHVAVKEALMKGNTRAMRVFLSIEGFDPAFDDSWALQQAARLGHTEIVRMFLKTGKMNVAAGGNEAIIAAAGEGHLDIVHLLLKEKGVDPGARMNFALRSAAQNGWTEVVKVLLEDHRVNPSELQDYAIKNAEIAGHYEIVSMFLEDGRVNPMQLLRYAQSNNRPKLVELLMNDERIQSIQYLDEIKDTGISLTSTKFLQFINTPKAWKNADYIHQVFSYEKVTKFLSIVLGIDMNTAKQITTMEALNEQVERLHNSIRFNDIRTSPIARMRNDFIWRYYAATTLYNENNRLKFNLLTPQKFQQASQIPQILPAVVAQI